MSPCVRVLITQRSDWLSMISVTGPSLISSSCIVGAEAAGLHRVPLPAQQGDKIFVERFGPLGRSCRGEAGAASFTTVAQQRELADHQDRAGDVGQCQIHLARRVVEDAQRADLVGQQSGVGFVVGAGHSQQDDQTLLDLADALVRQP